MNEKHYILRQDEKGRIRLPESILESNNFFGDREGLAVFREIKNGEAEIILCEGSVTYRATEIFAGEPAYEEWENDYASDEMMSF